MKLHADPRSDFLLISGHGAGYVAVGGRRHEQSLIVLQDRLIEPWGPAVFTDLSGEHLAQLAGLGCDVVLLGTGARQRFPAPALMRPLIEARIGVEVMDTAAACRTYNILVAEGRAVAAALIVEAETA